MNKESKLNLDAGDYAIRHCIIDQTYNGLEVHKMLCDAYIAGNNDTLEDDDERIKNSLINLIKMSNAVGGYALHKWEADEMLAWIEKQGNNDTLDDVSEDEKIRKAIIEGLREMKSNFHTISSIKIDDAIAWLEKQGEQKHIDKIEPKFKIGDWIINPKTGNVLQIKNVLLCGNKGNYEFDYSSMPIESVDKHYHLWTIEDAKDGDVLIIGDIIIIFKELVSSVTCECYCSLCENEFGIKCYCSLCENEFGITKAGAYSCCGAKPATKEQRDTLLKAMADAGYAFDFEKKELLAKA